MKDSEDKSLYWDEFNEIFKPCEGQNVSSAADFERAW